MNLPAARLIAVVPFLMMSFALAAQQPPKADLGLFEEHADVGGPAKAGSVAFDAAAKTYKIAGGGTNMWANADAFHFVWKKMSGDISLAADAAFPTPGGDPHRKAVLIIRQTLDADSPYVDAALHGDGLTSLQYRETKGGRTSEVQANVKGPKRLRIEKRGQDVSLWVAGPGEELKRSGATIRVKLDEPFYVGLGVCAHNNATIETAVFSNVELGVPPAAAAAPPPGAKPQVLSTLETITIASKDRRVVRNFDELIEAPNWSKDDQLYYNSKGRIYRIPSAGGEPTVVDTGFATRCNNDHGVSPDGTLLAISDQSQEGRKSVVYTVPVAGGTPTRVTTSSPSYWHGWSPDGKTIVFCGERDKEFDVYAIPAAGGDEKRLTTAKGLDDGPEFSPDGQFIYFNSDRTGTMQIWRMRPDGSGQEQVTNDEYNNWFAHPSPDGKWLVFLSYEKDVAGHPENKDVTLRIMPAAGGNVEVLAKLFGGQGTINVPSWSPDSKRLAFVSYQLVR